MSTIAARLVPVASRSPKASQKISSGTMTVPPPTPNRPLKKPPRVPITSSFTKRSRVTGGDTSGDEAGDRRRRVSGAPGWRRDRGALAPLRAEPGPRRCSATSTGPSPRSSSDPEDASGARGDRSGWGELAQRYGLVACVTGRRGARGAADGRDRRDRLLRQPRLRAVATGVPRPSSIRRWPTGAGRARDVRRSISTPRRSSAARPSPRGQGADPGASLARGRPESSRESAAERSPAGRGRGAVPHWGRKVLELRPAADIDKGTAVGGCWARAGLSRALFGGDDRGDLDAFARTDQLVRTRGAARRGLRRRRLAEARPELAEEADVWSTGPAGFSRC